MFCAVVREGKLLGSFSTENCTLANGLGLTLFDLSPSINRIMYCLAFGVFTKLNS